VTTEASKFAQAASSHKTTSSSAPPTTPSLSESILRRLETLAMGDDALDVGDVGIRETLKKMDLPVSPTGAKTALLKLNRWTPATAAASAAPKILPWDEDTLKAAKALEQHVQAKVRQSEGRRT